MSSKIWVSWFSESEIRSLIYNETKIAGRLYTLKELFSIHRADYCKYLWQFYKLVNAYLKTVSPHGVPPGFRFVILLHQLPGLQYYAWIVHFNVAFSFRNSEKLFQRKFHVFFLVSFYLFLFVWLHWERFLFCNLSCPTACYITQAGFKVISSCLNLLSTGSVIPDHNNPILLPVIAFFGVGCSLNYFRLALNSLYNGGWL